jgi:hypothetical protein
VDLYDIPLEIHADINPVSLTKHYNNNYILVWVTNLNKRCICRWGLTDFVKKKKCGNKYIITFFLYYIKQFNMANKGRLPNGNLTPETIIPMVTSKTLGDVTTALQSTLSVGGEVGFISITKQEIN